MTSLVGTWSLTRFALRRDRVRIAVWVAAIVALAVVTATSTEALYPTQADLDQAAVASQDNPAALAFNGPAVALDTLGGQIAFQVGAVGLTIVGLMALLMTTRLTRTEEESGRLELIRSIAVGRHAPLASASIVVSAMSVVVGLLVAASLLALDLPAGGSVVLGTSFTVVGLVFVGVAGLTAQVVESGRVAAGLAGAVLGASFVVRAVGDVGSGAASWASPIGLVQKARPYGGDVWWPLVLGMLLAGALFAGSGWLASHRDFGAGLVTPRPGPPTARPRLGRPLGLSVRLQRGTVLWWAVAVAITGIAYGSIANDIEDFVADNEAMADIIAAYGGASLTDAYLTTSLLVIAIIAGGAALQMALRANTEEGAGRAEPLLATPTSRRGWLGSHLAVAFVGSALIVLAGGVGIGVVYGVVIADATQVPRLAGAALVHVPAVWTLIGLACLLYGLVPRAVLAAWAVLAGALVVAMFGPVLDLPQWVLDLSPFQHTPEVPARTVELLPIAVLLAVTAATTALGVLGFRRRDVG